MKRYLFLFLLLAAVAQAQPRIEVSDIDFGTLGIGQSVTRPMRICNIGTDTLEFKRGGAGNVFIEWVKHTQQFTVSAAEIDRLANASLVGPDGSNACIDVMVTFMSNTRGRFRDSAQLFAFSDPARVRSRKDYAIWTATVLKPGALIAGHDWGYQWVVASLNPCTGNTATGYGATVEVTNEGSSDAVVESISITGADRGFFRIDSSIAATTLSRGDLLRPNTQVTRTQAIIFTPGGERSYSAAVRLVTIDILTAGRDTISAPLTGSGFDKHLLATNVAFASMTVGEMRLDSIILSNLGPLPITITGARIEGTGAADFQFATPSELPTIANPWIVPPGGERFLAFVFRPLSDGPTEARIRFTGDLNSCDNVGGRLSGNATSFVGTYADVTGNEFIDVDQAGNIRLRLAHAGRVTVEIFDGVGERVTTLEKFCGAGEESILFDRSRLAAGVYYLRAGSGTWSDTRRYIVR